MANWTKTEMAYLEDLADEFGVDLDTVLLLADLNPSEIYDGLVCDLEDAEMFFDSEEWELL